MNCRRCKAEIVNGVYCPECKEIIFEENIEKRANRRLSKLRNTLEYGISKVKEVVDGRCWCTAHTSCFRAGDNESPEHMDTKYERWKHHRSLGRIVFCELPLKDGMGQPDLIVVDKGFIFIEEIIKSEKEASIISKKSKYPFPINVIKAYKPHIDVTKELQKALAYRRDQEKLNREIGQHGIAHSHEIIIDFIENELLERFGIDKKTMRHQ